MPIMPNSRSIPDRMIGAKDHDGMHGMVYLLCRCIPFGHPGADIECSGANSLIPSVPVKEGRDQNSLA